MLGCDPLVSYLEYRAEDTATVLWIEAPLHSVKLAQCKALCEYMHRALHRIVQEHKTKECGT